MNIFKKLFRSKKKNWYEEAVQQAISEGILVDYLTRKGDKVAKMLMTFMNSAKNYDY